MLSLSILAQQNITSRTDKDINLNFLKSINSEQVCKQYSHLMTKPTKRHVRPAKTDQPRHPAQPDQSLRCPHEESLGP